MGTAVDRLRVPVASLLSSARLLCPDGVAFDLRLLSMRAAFCAWVWLLLMGARTDGDSWEWRLCLSLLKFMFLQQRRGVLTGTARLFRTPKFDQM